MKTVIYLDALLLVNFLIAYFLLQAVALFCGKDLSFWRSALGAGIAALSTLILLAPELPCFVSILFKAGSAFIVVLSAFGFCGWRPFLRQFVWFFLLNIGLAGLVLLAVTHGGFSGMEINNLTVYIDVSPLLLLFCSLAVYTSLRFILFLFGSPEPTERWQLSLTLNGTSLPPLCALHDTGFLLQDPLSGHPALLVSYASCKNFLPNDLRHFLDSFFIGNTQTPLPGMLLRLVPCKTVTGCQTLPAIGGFSVTLSYNGKDHICENALVVFTNQTLTDRSVQALFGNRFLQQTHHRSTERSV